MFALGEDLVAVRFSFFFLYRIGVVNPDRVLEIEVTGAGHRARVKRYSLIGVFSEMVNKKERAARVKGLSGSLGGAFPLGFYVGRIR